MLVTFGGINEEHNCYVIPRRPVFRPAREGYTELLVFCIGQQVWENQFDDDSSFMPTSVSVEEVV